MPDSLTLHARPGCVHWVLAVLVAFALASNCTADPPTLLDLAQPANVGLITGPSTPPTLLLNVAPPGLKLPAHFPSVASNPGSTSIPSPPFALKTGTPITVHENLYDYTGIDPVTQDLTWGNYINGVVGADRFYQTGVLDTDPNQVIGIFGQDTYTAHIDAGHPWAGPTGHSTLSGMVVNDPNIRYSPSDAQGNSLVVSDPQAHATACSMAIAGAGGELRTGSTSAVRVGIAPFTNLCTGAIATSVATDGSGSFDITALTYLSAYRHFAEATWSRTINYPFFGGSIQATLTGPTDVINTSFGFDDPAGVLPETIAMDALARAHPQTTFVVAAGNSGPGANTVGGPASAYNVISVGAVGDGTMAGINQVAFFSSRGPQDFAGNPAGNVVIPSVRAPVDIVAPGYYIVLATYNGPGTDPNAAIIGSGTSFAAPIVASGVALLDSLSYHLSANLFYPGFENTRDARVIKAVLLNSADKLPGWDNGQHLVNGVTRTEQGLDMAQGAGRINLNRAFDQYISGTLDPYGVAGTVSTTGWSLASVKNGEHLDYVLDTPLPAGNYLDATLVWFRNRVLPGLDPNTGDWDPATSSLSVTDLAMAQLNLEIWDSTFTTLYAISDTPYNDVQHLHYVLPASGSYGVRVDYFGQIFGDADPAGETYGLAWNVVQVPEPQSAMILVIAACALLARRRHPSQPRAARFIRTRLPGPTGLL